MELSSELIELETEERTRTSALTRVSRALARVPALLSKLFARHPGE